MKHNREQCPESEQKNPPCKSGIPSYCDDDDMTCYCDDDDDIVMIYLKGGHNWVCSLVSR